MDKNFFKNTKEKLENILMNDFVSFWEEVSVDPLYGGYLCGFDRDGELFFEDKSVWQQGRSLWMFSKLYNEFGKKQLWLDAAESGYDFINKYCFNPENGHMYFRVTRDGKPLQERRYYFSEAFAIMGYCEYYIATGNSEVKERAIKLFELFEKYYKTPSFAPKINPETRRYKGHSIVMIMLNVCQHMRLIDENEKYNNLISECINTITRDFIKPDMKALFETVNYDGSFVDTPDGRFLNPGHSMETAWFIMQEAVHRGDKPLFEKMMDVTKWSLERGWDSEKGGIFYFLDVFNKPVRSLEWDMKLFWVHCEAMIALVYSYMYTKNEKYLEGFEIILNYCIDHFSDPGHPEWYGHLHRDGTPISQIKGSDWKGPFHNVRAFMILTELFEKLEKGETLDF